MAPGAWLLCCTSSAGRRGARGRRSDVLTANGGSSSSSSSSASGSPLAWGMGQGGERGLYKAPRGGGGKKKKQNNSPDPSAACKARQTFRKCEYFAYSPFRGGVGEQESAPFPGWRGRYHGKEPGRMEGGGRSSLPGC